MRILGLFDSMYKGIIISGKHARWQQILWHNDADAPAIDVNTPQNASTSVSIINTKAWLTN